MSIHVELNDKEAILMQAVGTIQFLLELHENRFTKSKFYQKKVKNLFARQVIDKCNINNQGMVVLSLYAFLVIPSESFMEDLKDGFNDLNKWIDDVCLCKNSTYSTDAEEINYTRHMRNAIAHNNIKFEPSGYIEFIDKNPKNEEKCSFKIPVSQLGSLIQKLGDIILNYLKAK